MSLITSLLTGGSNSHEESSETANGAATDLIVKGGVVGALTNTSGVAPATGGFAVNAQGTPDMTVAVSAGVAYVQATPSSQNSQTLRVRNTASANVTISANASGSTKYDWLYIVISAANAANPNSAGDNVATLTTSRSSSATTDDGTPPTYGTLLAVVTVANGAASIANASIADKRVRIGAVGGLNDENGNEVIKTSATASAVNELTATNAATGNAPSIAATGSDTNIGLDLRGKGNRGVELSLRTQTDNSGSIANTTQTGLKIQVGWGQVTGAGAGNLNDTVTFPTAFTTVLGVVASPLGYASTSDVSGVTGFTAGAWGAKAVSANVRSITTSGCVVELGQSSGTFTSNVRFGYSWIAWGI